ncbi:MAG: universal stress protein [Cyanobacteria bacterium P01_H01_bin.121]
MIKKILLADSGQGQAEDMLKMLLRLPSIQDTKITILHAVPPQITPEELTTKWEEGGKVLAAALQSLQLDPQNVSTILRQGDPKDVVCQVADELETDLIIMGSRGLRRLRAILENSVSQYVFQLSSRPMLLVKDDIYVTQLRTVLVAMDQSQSAQYCLKLALSLLKGVNGGKLILGHLGTRKPFENAEADPILAAAADIARREGIAYKCYSRGGKTGPGICDLARETNANLTIIGSPDRRPSIAKNLVDLDRLLGSSTSDYVRVNIECPVLLARLSI